MSNSKIVGFIGESTISIVEAMSLIDKNNKGILFIVDDMKHLLGSLSDGDIRRWLLSGGDIKANVNHAINNTPIILSVEKVEKAFLLMQEKMINALPIVNNDNELVDIIFPDSETLAYKKDKKRLYDVPVVIMAGGMGTRLYPYTKILPKPLIPIGDTSIVERILNYFSDFGINKFYMTVNYKKGMIKSYFEDQDIQYKIEFVEEMIPLGTGGSLKLIKDPLDKPLFVANCDSLIIADYGDIYKYHQEAENDITVIASLKNITVPYGIMHFGENGELLRIEEKPKLSYFINTGMYVVNPETIKLIPENQMFHMTHLIETVMKNGGKVGTYPVSEDSFLDMGEFSEMRRMEEKLNIVSE